MLGGQRGAVAVISDDILPRVDIVRRDASPSLRIDNGDSGGRCP